MNAFIDLTDTRFGRLIVVCKNTTIQDKLSYQRWDCVCDCGKEFHALRCNLRSGDTTSCGCYRREATSAFAKVSSRKHGYKGTKTYRAWSAMKTRCLNVNGQDYPQYGARGIKICDRWKDSFMNFLEDMGEAPPDRSIDRINNDGNYEPGNCRWATLSEQNLNRRPPKRLRGVTT